MKVILENTPYSKIDVMGLYEKDIEVAMIRALIRTPFLYIENSERKYVMDEPAYQYLMKKLIHSPESNWSSGQKRKMIEDLKNKKYRSIPIEVQ